MFREQAQPRLRAVTALFALHMGEKRWRRPILLSPTLGPNPVPGLVRSREGFAPVSQTGGACYAHSQRPVQVGSRTGCWEPQAASQSLGLFLWRT